MIINFADTEVPYAWTLLKRHAISIVVFAILLSLAHTRYGNKLRQFPGPFLASFTRLWQGWFLRGNIILFKLTGVAQYGWLGVVEQRLITWRFIGNMVSFSFFVGEEEC
jgi:hypothetical protein